MTNLFKCKVCRHECGVCAIKCTKKCRSCCVKITKSKAKKKAWDAFSRYIRTKYSRLDGRIECYTCGKVKEFKEMSAGHGIGGRNGGVLFMEEVVRAQCAGCNIWGRGQYQIFTRKLIDELGLDLYDKLVTRSRGTTQYKISDYQEVEAKYKALIEEL